MRRTLFVLFLSLFAVAGFSDSADAKRGGRLPIVIPIPGLGGGGSNIVKVLDLPDTPMLRRHDGIYVDLGYMHEGGGEGSWVGYLGSDRKYVPLTEEALQMLMLVAGIDELPPVPERKSSLGGSAILIGLFLLFLVPKLLKKALRLFGSSGGGGRRRNHGDLDWVHLDKELLEAAQEIDNPKPKPRSARRAAAHAEGSTGFGRRKARPT